MHELGLGGEGRGTDATSWERGATSWESERAATSYVPTLSAIPRYIHTKLEVFFYPGPEEKGEAAGSPEDRRETPERKFRDQQ